LFSPVFVLVVAECLDSGATFAQPDGIHAEVMAGRIAVLADTFQAKRVLARLGPEIHQMVFPQIRLGPIQIERLAQLYAAQDRLPDAVVVRAGEFQYQPQRFLFLNVEREFDPTILFRPGFEEQLAVGLKIYFTRSHSEVLGVFGNVA